jgi:hypothetical protein
MPALNPREKSVGVAAAGALPPADGRPPAAGDTDDDNPLPDVSELGDNPPVPAEDRPLPDGGLNPLPNEDNGDPPPLPLDETGDMGGVIAGVADEPHSFTSPAGLPFKGSAALPGSPWVP